MPVPGPGHHGSCTRLAGSRARTYYGIHMRSVMMSFLFLISGDNSVTLYTIHTQILLALTIQAMVLCIVVFAWC